MRKLIAVCFSYWIVVSALATPQLSYYSEEFPPFNFTNQQGQFDGLAVKVLQAVKQQLDEPMPAVQIMPWARAYYLLEHQPNTVLFSTARSPSRVAQFQWACPIFYSRIVLLSLAHRRFEINQPQDLLQYNLATIRADVGEQSLLNLGIPANKLTPSRDVEQLVKRLIKERVDLIAVSEGAAFQQLRRMALAPDTVQVAYVLEETEACFAFSQDVERQYIERFRAALQQVVAQQRYRSWHLQYLGVPVSNP